MGKLNSAKSDTPNLYDTRKLNAVAGDAPALYNQLGTPWKQDQPQTEVSRAVDAAMKDAPRALGAVAGDRASLTAGVVAASEPALRAEHFSPNDRLALLNVAFTQASRESNSSNPVTLERVEETFNRLVSIVKAK